MIMDKGLELDEYLRKRTREELEDELVETREFESIYRRYRNCIVRMFNAKENGEIFILKRWIEELNEPTESCSYTAEQWEKVQELKEELKKFAKMLGYINEDENAFMNKTF